MEPLTIVMPVKITPDSAEAPARRSAPAARVQR
jgi:hypothetical protein